MTEKNIKAFTKVADIFYSLIQKRTELECNIKRIKMLSEIEISNMDVVFGFYENNNFRQERFEFLKKSSSEMLGILLKAEKQTLAEINETLKNFETIYNEKFARIISDRVNLKNIFEVEGVNNDR